MVELDIFLVAHIVYNDLTQDAYCNPDTSRYGLHVQHDAKAVIKYGTQIVSQSGLIDSSTKQNMLSAEILIQLQDLPWTISLTLRQHATTKASLLPIEITTNHRCNEHHAGCSSDLSEKPFAPR